MATCISPGEARGAWFDQAANIPTLTPPTNDQGDPTGGPAKNKGGEAAAIFDVNDDDVLDVVIANGSSYYFVALGDRTGNELSFSVAPYLAGVEGDGRRSIPKALGLTDFNEDARLDLYLSNTGDGSIRLENPRDLSDDPSNVDASTLTRDHRYRSYLNLGGGKFGYKDVGADALGNTRSALFADFDSDGYDDLFAFTAPYFGAWWGGSSSPTQLLPGRAGGTFGENVLRGAVVNSSGQPLEALFEDDLGRGDLDIKGAVVRDFDGDGRPDVIASAYSDVWDNVGVPPLAPADRAGAALDLDGDNLPDGGYQGDWRHGILALRNISKPSRIRFQNVSASATDQSIGFRERMHVYETIPTDFNTDGRLDLVATGVRNFTAHDSLEYDAPLIQLYRNDSTPGKLRFTNVTKRSGLDFMNRNRALSERTGGRFPISIPNLMLDGDPLVLAPLLSAGASVDIDNDARPDIVLIDRQFTSRDPLTGEEFSLWVFRNKGRGRFKMVDPAVHGLTHTARDITYGDFNADGRLDLVTVNGSGGGQSVDDNNYVFLNQMRNDNNWVDLLISSRRSPLGLGARVTVYRAGTNRVLGTDEMRTDFAYRSRRDARLHFGLADTDCVDVLVQGLGRPTRVRGLRANRVQTINLRHAASARSQAGCRIPRGTAGARAR